MAFVAEQILVINKLHSKTISVTINFIKMLLKIKQTSKESEVKCRKEYRREDNEKTTIGNVAQSS